MTKLETDRQLIRENFKQAEKHTYLLYFNTILTLELGKRFSRKIGVFRTSVSSYKEKGEVTQNSIKFYGIGNPKHLKRIKKLIRKNNTLLETLNILLDLDILPDCSNLNIVGRYLL